MHVLARYENRVVVMLRYVKRERPLKTVFEFRGGPPTGALGPHLYLPELPSPLVVTHNNPAASAGARCTRPNDVRIRRIGGREPALAASNRVPHAPGNTATPEPACAAVARAAGGGSVLAVTHDVVRNRVVCSHVIHLRDRKLNSVPRFAAVDRNSCTAVVAHDHAVAIRGIDPHVVIVSTRTLAPAERRAGAPAVGRAHERRGEKEGFVRIVRQHNAVVVVAGATAEVPIVGHELPVAAPVVRPPQLAALGFLTVPRNSVTRFDQSVHAIRIRRRETNVDFSDRQLWQPVSFELRPVVTSVSGHVNPTAWTTALPTPRVDFDLPHSCEEYPRVVGIHFQTRRTGVFVHEQHVLPRLPTVSRAEDSTLTLRTVTVTQRSHVYDVGVGRVDDDARCAARPREAHVPPVLPPICGFVDPGAERHVRANVRLTGSSPHDCRIRGCHREGTDGMIGLVVEDRPPILAAVLRFPDAAGCGAHVVGERIAHHTRHRGNPVAHRTNVPIAQLAVLFRRDVLRCHRPGSCQDGK